MSAYSKVRLDEVAVQILECLTENARMSYAEIGRRVGLASPSVAERVRQMEEAGLIKGYQAVLDLTLLGRPIEAVVRLAVRSPNDSAYVSTGLRRHPEILEARRVTGPDGWVVRISAADVETLEQTIDGLAEFGVPTTAMVLSTPVPPRHPPLRRQPSPSDH